MVKRKKKRLNVRIDMTPMVDVVMLLLTFFMMTTQFKPPEEVDVILPMSHSEFKLPESNVMMIYVNKEGRLFLGVDSQPLMEKLFGRENRYRKSVEVTRNELPNLLITARMNNVKLRTVIKGDKDAPYALIEDVMDILVKTKITRFSLVTELERGV